jgi:hypothetical protein
MSLTREKRKRRLRAWHECEEIVEEFGDLYPFDRHVVVTRLCERVGVPIELRPVSLPDSSVTGFSVPLKHKIVMHYAQDTTESQQDRIICHECGHFLCRHVTLPVDNVAPMAQLLSPLPPALQMRLFHQYHNYGTEEEQQADLLAAMMLAKGGRHTFPPRPISMETDDAIKQLRAVHGL